MTDCIFCKIRDGVIAKDFVYQDSDVMVFPDIHPIKPVHLLIIPKKHVKDIMSVDEKLMFKLTKVVSKMIAQEKLGDKGYRIAINGGGAQVVNHLHLHLVGPLGKAVSM